MFISIKNHIIFLLIFFTLLPFVLLRIVAYPIIQRDLKTVIMEDLEVAGQKQAKLVSTWMRGIMKDALVVANNPYMIKSAKITQKDEDYKDIVRYLEMIVAEYGYKSAFVSNDKGLVTVATSEEEVGRDISETDFFKNAIQGKTFATKIVPSEVPLTNEFGNVEAGLPTMFVATPLMDEDDAIVGVVTLRINVSILSNLMLSNKFGKTGETYLINRDGYMLTESRFTKRLKKIGKIDTRSSLELKLVDPATDELTTGVRQCVAGYDGSDANGYNDYGGITVLGVWQWLPEYNWGVVTEIDKTEVYGVAYNLNTLGMVLIFAMVFPILFVAYFVGKRFSTPILGLTEVTEKMASGDLSQRVNIKRNNEIGVLANSINTMAKSLDKKTKETVQSEKRYRSLFNSLREGIYQCEPKIGGELTWINQAGAEMLGYKSPEEMIGMKTKDIWGLDPEDRKQFWEKLEKDGVCKNFVCRCKRKNGEVFYTERTSSFEREENGNAISIHGVFRDISETKKAELEIIESEKKYRLLFDSLKEGVYQCEPGVEGTFTWVNQAGAEMFGYKSPEEMVGTKVKNIYVDEADRKRLVEKLEKDGIWRNFESFCKKKNGTCFYTERTSNMIKNEKGEPVRIEGIIRDITERKRLNDELRESEEHKRRLLNSLKEGVYQCEPGTEGVFTWINQAGAEMFGYKSPEEIIGTKVKNIYVDPDDRRKLVEKLEKDGIRRNFEGFCKKKNGEQFYIERTSNMFRNEEGKPVRIEGIFRYIAERSRLVDEVKKPEKHQGGGN
ncbi:MAG: PAS domain S-box protein [Candidatus Scalindua sp.]